MDNIFKSKVIYFSQVLFILNVTFHCEGLLNAILIIQVTLKLKIKKIKNDKKEH